MPKEECGVVVDTTGCPKGLSVEEQMAWAVTSKHPMLSESWPTPQHLREAVAFEANADFEELDKEREALMRKWLYTAQGYDSVIVPCCINMAIQNVS